MSVVLLVVCGVRANWDDFAATGAGNPISVGRIR
jgi:hypothetical protein